MMNIPYNKYYQETDYFGKPYPGLMEFFETYPMRPRILDLGCGQGRDTLFLGSIGYQVLGVDISDVGIKQLNEVAQSQQLPVKGIVHDIYDYSISKEVDMVLLDSMFHFYKKDLVKEKALLLRILDEIKCGGIICNFMQKGVNREKILKTIIEENQIPCEIVKEAYTIYPEFGGEFHMYILKKL